MARLTKLILLGGDTNKKRSRFARPVFLLSLSHCKRACMLRNKKSPGKCQSFLFVGMARFELATSWSQTRRDNRATLHPEHTYLGVIRTFFSAERVGFEPTVQFNPYDDLANRSFRPLRHLSS